MVPEQTHQVEAHHQCGSRVVGRDWQLFSSAGLVSVTLWGWTTIAAGQLSITIVSRCRNFTLRNVLPPSSCRICSRCCRCKDFSVPLSGGSLIGSRPTTWINSIAPEPSHPAGTVTLSPAAAGAAQSYNYHLSLNLAFSKPSAPSSDKTNACDPSPLQIDFILKNCLERDFVILDIEV